MNQGNLPVLGAVLAGGDSRRFGSPKALAELGGRRLVDRMLATVRAAGLEPLLVEREGGQLAGTLGAPGAIDAVPSRGPVSGLVAALRRARSEGKAGVVLLGVDQPMLPPALVRHLGERGLGGSGCVAAEGSVGLEPLGAYYGTDALSVAEALLEGDEDPSLKQVLEACVTRRLSIHELDSFGDVHLLFMSVNTPEDFERARKALEPDHDCSIPAGLPAVFCVVGRKNDGKTTFAVALIRALRARGRRVMAAKHGHDFEVDHPGTDSWRIRHEGGAERIAMIGPEDGVVIGGWGPSGEPSLAAVVERYLGEAEIVIAEGFKSSPFPRIEVLRGGSDRTPLCMSEGRLGGSTIAVVSDDPVPNLPRDIVRLHGSGAVSAAADLIDARLARS